MAIVGREAALIDKMCEKEVDLEARKASRRLSLAGGVAVFSLSLRMWGRCVRLPEGMVGGFGFRI